MLAFEDRGSWKDIATNFFTATLCKGSRRRREVGRERGMEAASLDLSTIAPSPPGIVCPGLAASRTSALLGSRLFDTAVRR